MRGADSPSRAPTDAAGRSCALSPHDADGRHRPVMAMSSDGCAGPTSRRVSLQSRRAHVNSVAVFPAVSPMRSRPLEVRPQCGWRAGSGARTRPRMLGSEGPRACDRPGSRDLNPRLPAPASTSREAGLLRSTPCVRFAGGLMSALSGGVRPRQRRGRASASSGGACLQAADPVRPHVAARPCLVTPPPVRQSTGARHLPGPGDAGTQPPAERGSGHVGPGAGWTVRYPVNEPVRAQLSARRTAEIRSGPTRQHPPTSRAPAPTQPSTRPGAAGS